MIDANGSQEFGITYVAPGRAHHFPYAEALAKANLLTAFVSGYPQFRGRVTGKLKKRIRRRNFLQILYLLSLKFPLIGSGLSDFLGYFSKVVLDRAALAYAGKSRIFLAYNGCALDTMQRLRGTRTIRVLEMVNSHVSNIEEIMATEHDLHRIPYNGIYYREKNRRLEEYKEADYILCPSEFVIRSFKERGFAPHKLLKNPYGVSHAAPPLTCGESAVPATGFRVLYVGSIHLRKGLSYLLEAFVTLDVPNKELWLVGPLTEAPGIDLHQLPENVHLKGVLKGAQLAEAYASSDVFVLPSVEEGLALVLGEALSFGLPIIATENTGAEDLFSDGIEGFIVPIRDQGAIHQKLQLLARDETLRLMLSKNASKRAKTLREIPSGAESLVQLMQRLIEEHEVASN
jgi:starch synthase